MATIKAGTYRFNDVLNDVPDGICNQQISLDFTVTATLPAEYGGGTYVAVCNSLNLSIQYFFHVVSMEPAAQGISFPYSAPVYFPVEYQGFYRWNVQSFGEGIKTIAIPNDTEVSEEFEPWFTANTKRLSTITYNGSTIATLNGGQTATIKCAGKKMKSDIVVEVAEQGGGGGDATFNIAYGDTEPTDTSKLWVKTSEPSAVQVTSKLEGGNEELEMGIATLPTAADGIASAVVGTKVYLFGGYGSGYLSTINVFDTESNTISTLSTALPTAADGIASAVVGTKVYLFGGYRDSGDLSTINVFDTESNTRSTLSTKLPTAASGIASAVVGTKVYLFGGSGSDGYLSTINVFDTESNTISTLSTKLPTAASGIASAAVGTKVYLFGGYGSGSRLSTINVFDTESNTISTLSTALPTAASTIASAVVGTKVYLFGGRGSSSRLSTINVFDTESNTISTLSTTLPTEAGGIASAVVGTKVYLFGGYGSGSRLSTINALTVALALASNNLLIEATLAENIFNLLSNVEIGVQNVYLGNADGVGERVGAALYVDGAWANI